jgi:hypothetical protein
MTMRSFQFATYTPTAVADTVTYTSSTYQGIGASAATTGVIVREVMVSGQATSSSVAIAQFARDHIVGASLTALAAPASDGPLGSLGPTAQSGSLSFVAATTNPQRSAVTTSARLNLAINAFGGLVRWNAAPGQEWKIAGISVDISESSLSYYTGSGTGVVGSHIIYESE